MTHMSLLSKLAVGAAALVVLAAAMLIPEIARARTARRGAWARQINRGRSTTVSHGRIMLGSAFAGVGIFLLCAAAVVQA